MSTRKLRIKSSIFNCPVCINRYDQSEHKPLLMPCGKSVCQQCIEANLSASGSFWCPFCNVNHKQINNHFPANDALVYLVKNRAAITDEEIESEEPSDRSSKSSNLSPKLAAILDEIGVASTDLDKSIYKSAQGLNEKFARMESEINERVEKMIDEIKKARVELLKELKKHQQKLLGEENAVLKERNELKISQIDLVNSLSNQSQISEDAQRRAEEIQKRLVKLKEDSLNWGKAELKLDKLQLEQMDLGHLIIENHQESTITSKHNVKFKEPTQLQQHQPLYLSYKIPPKSKNFHLGFQSTKMLIKVSEFEEVENFSFRLNIQVVDKNGLGVNSRSLQLDSMRLLRIESNLSNEFFVILVRNHFSNPSKSILLIDSDLNLTSRIDFTSQTIIGLYMTDRWIYIVNKNGSTNKYSYENGELKFLKHFQAKSSTVGFHDANFYCIDWEKGKIKIFREENGELSNSFVLACLNGDKDANSWLIKVDSLGRLNILNRNSFELSVYNINGDIAFEKKFDSARLKLVDMFFPFNDSTFSLVDHKNKSIHFF